MLFDKTEPLSKYMEFAGGNQYKCINIELMTQEEKKELIDCDKFFVEAFGYHRYVNYMELYQ